MESNLQRQSDPLNKQEQQTADEKEMKAKRRYYGKIFVTCIFVLIVYEYYVYVYEIMLKKINGKQIYI